MNHFIKVFLVSQTVVWGLPPLDVAQTKDISVFETYQSPIDLSILPVKLPATDVICKQDIVRHDFANSYGNPFVGNYTSPLECINGGEIARVVIRFESSVKGRQYDRFGAIYIDGSEILRTTTAEPTPLGIDWQFDKDISNYAPLFYNNRVVTMTLGNLVNSVYTGVFHVRVSLELHITSRPMVSLRHSIIPISKGPGTEAWFTMNDSSILTHPVTINQPGTLVRAELEVFFSGHDCDEFYYLNPPDEYTRPRKSCVNGPYRELSVMMDGNLLGSVWPYPAVYTGGITLTLWRPLSGLGSFDVPSETLNLAPYLKMLSGTRNFQFQIANGTSLWLVTANLHLWYQDTPSQDSVVYNPIVEVIDNTQLPFVPPTDDGDYVTTVSKIYTITSLSYQINPNGLFSYLITRLTQRTKFYHHLTLSQRAAVSDFDVRCQTSSSIESFIWESPNLENPTDLTSVFTARKQSQPRGTPYVQSRLYLLMGSTYSRDMQDQPGYDLKTNMTLYSLRKSTGGSLLGNPDASTELKLSSSAFATSGTTTMPSAGDCIAQASVRHQEFGVFPIYEPCYSRDVKANHGFINYDQSNRDCNSVSPINW